MCDAAAVQLGDNLPEGTELRFLGRELLRGIDRLEAIHELVDRNRPTPAAPPPPAAVEVGLPPPLEAASPAFFAGREDLLSTIDTCRERAVGGEFQAVLLCGEPGAGKSAIAAVAARRARGDGWTVLFGSCDEHVTTPYEPFRDAVGGYVEVAPPAVLAEHIAAHGGEIGRLTSKLARRVGTLPTTEAVDPETSRRLLFEAVGGLLERAAADHAVLLVVDDLQWADPNTMLLVSRLAKLRRNARLLLLATYRSSASDRGEFAFFLGELRPNPAVTELKVEGLDEDALFSVLQAAAGHPLGHEGRAVAAYLHDETDGNPFFVAELVRHFVETGVIAADDRGVWRARADLATVKVPGTVRAVFAGASWTAQRRDAAAVGAGVRRRPGVRSSSACERAGTKRARGPQRHRVGRSQRRWCAS